MPWEEGLDTQVTWFGLRKTNNLDLAPHFNGEDRPTRTVTGQEQTHSSLARIEHRISHRSAIAKQVKITINIHTQGQAYL